MEQKHYAFFQNRECEFFPCHTGVPEAEFNCLFCYCPLYPLGESCPGNYLYLENGVKSCENCVLPHIRDNYSLVISKFPELAALAAKRKE
ncbi:MAG: cysteine-rich small domain-containing protein [Oscillospiraceae bacterium]|nr:cysteine-rich small domain-containing protein [Oscillospiraceae bacterium]